MLTFKNLRQYLGEIYKSFINIFTQNEILNLL